MQTKVDASKLELTEEIVDIRRVYSDIISASIPARR